MRLRTLRLTAIAHGILRAFGPLLPLDGLNAAAAYSTRKLRTAYTGAAMRVRRSSDNAEADIGFGADGGLDLDALTLHCGAPRRPLDTIAGAAAYSTRLVRSAYAGPCMRVRRDSDNTEQDIGFTAAGDLDTVALLAFTGANSGFVTVWYDQSGSARHATQTTAANQPRIVNAGVMHTLNGRPTVDQVTVNGKLNIPAFSGMTSTIVSAVYALTNGGFAPWQLNQVDHFPWTNNIAYAGPFSATRPQFATWSAAANELIVASAVQTGTALAVYRNGTQNGTTQASAFTTPSSQGNRTIFGGLSGKGFVSELIITTAWDGGPANRQTLERSQAAYFGITHVDPVSGFVATWYDQSGNARDATQATAANQPRIVNAGVIDTAGGLPAIVCVDTTDHLASAAWGNTPQPCSRNAVIQVASPVVSGGHIINSSGATNTTEYAGSNAITMFAGAVGPNRTAIAGERLIYTAEYNGASSRLVKNGDPSAEGNAGPNAIIGLSIGSRLTTSGSRTTFQEVALFGSILSTTDRQTLERSQGAYFGITVA